MKRLYLVRHGRTEWNRNHRFTGDTDLALDETGRRQAYYLAGILREYPIDITFTSDLIRAKKTAGIIREGRKTPVVVDRRLREISFGKWEGLTYGEIRDKYPEELKKWENDIVSVPPPEGESFSSLAERAAAFIEERLVDVKSGYRNILVVTHGGPARVILTYFLKIPVEEYWRVKMNNGAVAVLEYERDKGILCQLYNP